MAAGVLILQALSPRAKTSSADCIGYFMIFSPEEWNRLPTRQADHSVLRTVNLNESKDW